MRLGEKLARFSAAPASATTAPGRAGFAAVETRASLRDALDRVTHRHARDVITPRTITAEAPPSLAEALPGRATSTSHGTTWLIEERAPTHARHGLVAFSRALEADFTHLERLTGDPRLTGFDVRRALFLDIEATGLEHGSGTLAFLIGMGYFEGDELVLEQVLLRDHDEEAALLELTWEAVESFDFLVSFNGKSFDLSVLHNRMVMHRMCSRRECELKLRPHLDLLHVSRGIYKGLWSDVRLQTLERRVLGLVREDDMPGALAPTCWFSWLKEADPRPLVGIARHNRLDVLSMVTLAGLVAYEAEPRADAGRPSRVALNLARLYLRKKAYQEALRVLESTPPLADADERASLLEVAVTAARRAGEHARYQAALEALVALDPTRDKEVRALARARARSARSPHAVTGLPGCRSSA